MGISLKNPDSVEYLQETALLSNSAVRTRFNQHFCRGDVVGSVVTVCARGYRQGNIPKGSPGQPTPIKGTSR